MLQTIKKLILSASLFGLLAVPALVPATVGAQTDIEGGLCAGANLDVKDTTCDSSTDTEAQDKVNSFITTIINIFSVVVGVVAVIMIIIGGFKYITSGGDSGNISSAKNTILFAVVGLIIVALAQFLVRFILTKVTAA